MGVNENVIHEKAPPNQQGRGRGVRTNRKTVCSDEIKRVNYTFLKNTDQASTSALLNKTKRLQ